MLDDYTKSDSGLLRFFNGNWNRHHIKEVSAITTIAKNINTTMTDKELLTHLKKIVLVNNQGTLANIIELIEAKIDNSILASDHNYNFTH